MTPRRFQFVFLGLSITSSWGNGHAMTYRALLKNLVARGHDVVFLERDLPFFAANRDLSLPPFGTTHLYRSLEELFDRFAPLVGGADLTVVGSYVPDGEAVGVWVQDHAGGRAAFYDMDTPVTLARLAAGNCRYLSPEMIAGYALYLSFTGGPTLDLLERRYGSPWARPLYCAVDPEVHRPEPGPLTWDLGYLGTYSADRQLALSRLLMCPSELWPDGRFVVAGPQYPESIVWQPNVERVEHLGPDDHRAFYNAQRFTLNVTRGPMVEAGWSPSIRLFEAGACGTPVITDRWEGLASMFLPGREIVVADNAVDVLRTIHEMSERRRSAIATAARTRILAEHTSMHRAETLEQYTHELCARHVRAAIHSQKPRTSEPAKVNP